MENGKELAPAVITPQQAIEKIAKDFPKEAEVLSFLLKKDIISLATDEVFALRDNNNEIRAFKQALSLSAKAGTLIQPVPGGEFCVSAQGYEVWQEAAGACVIFPSEVLVGNDWQSNPAVVRDEKNGRILMIYARAVAFRFSSKGIPMVSDWTTIYDTPSYRMIDLLGKAKKTPQAFKLLPIDMKPDADAKGTWACYKFDEASSLWMNTAHEEALTWLASIINREKKAIDFAQTFAKRNALKHLSGIQKSPSNAWTFPVISWRPSNNNIIKWDATQYAALQERVGKLISGDRSEFGTKAPQIEMKAGQEKVSDDAAAGAIMEGEMDVEDKMIEAGNQLQENEIQEPAIPAGETEEEKKIFANAATTAQMFPDVYMAVVKDLNLSGVTLTVATAKAIYNEVSKRVS